MNPDDVITIKAHKADGVCYQWWDATVIAVDDQCVVLSMPKGASTYSLSKGYRPTEHRLRCTYQFDKLYTFIESFDAAGALVEIYIDISDLPRIVGDELHYTDYELDVVRTMPDAAVLIDEDEFAEAIVTYGYSTEFQVQCYAAAREALAVANAVMANP